MQKIYDDTRILDKACRENYFLSEELMMENAAAALEKAVMEHIYNPAGFYLNRSHCLILCGTGNNGGDGYALGRRLVQKSIAITICEFGEPKTEIALLQKKRAQSLGISFISFYELDQFIEEQSVDLRVIVDCVFGSGFHGQLPAEVKVVFDILNTNRDAYKISCDIPSGNYFCADETITMGALKKELFSDKAKDLCGKITVASLGVSRNNFENALTPQGTLQPVSYLLDKSDMDLPFRNKQNVNKGSFGHTAIVAGEKPGAACMAGLASLKFGAGLATLVSPSEISAAPFELMCSKEFPQATSAVVFGMGLGRENKTLFDSTVEYLKQHSELPCVIDADAFYFDDIKDFLQTRQAPTILTPHPKEFTILLEKCGMGTFTVEQAIEQRLELSKKFCETFKEVTLVLKGANVLISTFARDKNSVLTYINSFGTQALAKAGSGDVLSGMCGALLAQKQNALQAAVNASLAHAIASTQIKNNFALTPSVLLRELEGI